MKAPDNIASSEARGSARILAIREEKRCALISTLVSDLIRLRKFDSALKFWLIGSFAIGNWDAYSDVDVVCVSHRRYDETDFTTSDQYAMDVFSLNESEFQQRLGKTQLFKNAVENGVPL